MKTSFDEILLSFQKDLPVMLEAGMIATHQGKDSDALKMFCAAQILSEEKELPQICLAYLSMQRMEMATAKNILKKTLEKNPENYLATSLLGLCLVFFPSSFNEGMELINKAESNSSDEQIKNICDIARRWINDDKRFKSTETILG